MAAMMPCGTEAGKHFGFCALLARYSYAHRPELRPAIVRVHRGSNESNDPAAPAPGRLASSARRALGRARHQFHAVLGPCHQGRALPVRRSRREGDRADRAARIYRPDLPWLLSRGEAGQLYGFRVHGPYEPEHGPSLQSQQAAARPLRPRPCRRACRGIRRCSATRWKRATTSPSTSATARPSCRNAWSPTCTSLGVAERAAADAALVEQRSSTRPMSAASPSCTRKCRRTCAAPTRASPRPRSSSTSRISGVTAVELLPVHTFVTDKFLIDKGLTNYWGYNTIGFFAPHPALCRRSR